MKKLLLIVVFFMTLVSCNNDNLGKNEERFAQGSNAVNVDNIKNNYDVIEIEGCEYIVYTEYHGYGGYGFMAHKGNCNNPIHK